MMLSHYVYVTVTDTMSSTIQHKGQNTLLSTDLYLKSFINKQDQCSLLILGLIMFLLQQKITWLQESKFQFLRKITRCLSIEYIKYRYWYFSTCIIHPYHMIPGKIVEHKSPIMQTNHRNHCTMADASWQHPAGCI